MTDTTPVTDDDRDALDLANMIEKNPHSYSDTYRGAARAIRAHVPAPPKSLADQLRTYAHQIIGADGYPLPEGDSEILSIADRVENVVANQDVLHQKLCQAVKERDAATESLASERAENLHIRHVLSRREAEIEDQEVSLDDKSAEVERLTRESAARLDQINALESKVDRMLATGSTCPADDLPAPADVPKGEQWRVKTKVFGVPREVSGIKSHGDLWRVVDDEDMDAHRRDSEVTLVARLVPDVRRVIDRPEALDKLPVGSIVLDEESITWTKQDDGRWDTYGRRRASSMLTDYSPVTVIHEPMVDSARRS